MPFSIINTGTSDGCHNRQDQPNCYILHTICVSVIETCSVQNLIVCEHQQAALLANRAASTDHLISRFFLDYSFGFFENLKSVKSLS